MILDLRPIEPWALRRRKDTSECGQTKQRLGLLQATYDDGERVPEVREVIKRVAADGSLSESTYRVSLREERLCRIG